MPTLLTNQDETLCGRGRWRPGRGSAMRASRRWRTRLWALPPAAPWPAGQLCLQDGAGRYLGFRVCQRQASQVRHASDISIPIARHSCSLEAVVVSICEQPPLQHAGIWHVRLQYANPVAAAPQNSTPPLALSSSLRAPANYRHVALLHSLFLCTTLSCVVCTLLTVHVDCAS